MPQRYSNGMLDRLLGKRLRVPPDGFIRVIDYMGGDAAVVQAARISYGRGTKSLNSDRQLIRYLVRHRHTSPFEMCELKLHVRVPMDCWRQWIRHRTASVNEYSTRYSLAIQEAATTSPQAWRLQATSNRQGSSGFLPLAIGRRLSKRERELHDLSRSVYEQRIELRIAREQARKDLPLATYTEAYWKIDLHNLLHFLELRMAPHAQQEIRAFGSIIGTRIVAVWCPIAWEAFVDYRLGAMPLSALEQQLVHGLAKRTPALSRLAAKLGFLRRNDTGWEPTREGQELAVKLRRLGLEDAGLFATGRPRPAGASAGRGQRPLTKQRRRRGTKTR